MFEINAYCHTIGKLGMCACCTIPNPLFFPHTLPSASPPIKLLYLPWYTRGILQSAAFLSLQYGNQAASKLPLLTEQLQLEPIYSCYLRVVKSTSVLLVVRNDTQGFEAANSASVFVFCNDLRVQQEAGLQCVRSLHSPIIYLCRLLNYQSSTSLKPRRAAQLNT